MPESLCGFNDVQGGASGSELLVAWGPTLIVDVGFDPNFKPGPPFVKPVAGMVESCIDSLLAAQLNLPIVDKRTIAGVHGTHEANVHLAQIHVVSQNFTIYGPFAAVELAAGGQQHKVLIGRTFLKNFTMTYEGLTGTVKLARNP